MNNKNLTRQQKEAVALLSIGTLLEYFDLMLYVHMSVLLNNLFFPQSNPTTAQLLGVTAFCLTYILRPVGGFFIGRVGDIIGRKFTLIITTFTMAISCIIMANLQPYSKIGITATIIVMLCRALQGFSSLGELMGAQLYLTEILKTPHKNIASGIVVFSAKLGGMFTLIVAYFAMSNGSNWRIAFWIGAIISIVGYIARRRLRETKEFVDYKTRISKKIDIQEKTNEIFCIRKWFNSLNGKNAIAFFFTEFHNPACFYVSYVYIVEIIKLLGYSDQYIVFHNLKVAIFEVAGVLFVAYLVKTIHPIKIANFCTYLFCLSLPVIPYILHYHHNLFTIMCIQCMIMTFAFSTAGTLDSIQYKYFPIEKRFTYVATIFGISNPLSKLIVSFSLIPLYRYLGHYAIWVIFIPVVVGYLWAVSHFKKLEIKRGSYYSYPDDAPPNEDTAFKEEDFNYEDLGDEYEPFKDKCEYSTTLLNKLLKISSQRNNKLNIKLIKKAIIFTKKWHNGQMRKTGDKPFYSHPFKVAEMVAEHYCKTDLVVSAILHDVVEDSECSVELIEKKFNKRIAQMVDRLTKNRFEHGQHSKLSLEEILKRLQEVNDNEALFIKKFDRMHNLQTIEGLTPEKQRKIASETNNHFLRLVTIIGDKLNIYGKIYLENKMFRYCCGILRKKR